ncbi:unnamed protein product [Rotaria sp. Silwood2]|nr:unnamed protein product [Rotaria sp. Silwood2]CAF2668938.1 unnamed protein product [Rotaria sp. Silwood2]CAF3090241.1 unnamed protein product [Rotaria sp. Silwood2]CAF3983769.1 unnamed protein product [Rotaria sp. Silwood2]CAF4171840.1 unnamed protein product [Rotaria sp. Silwood2]
MSSRRSLSKESRSHYARSSSYNNDRSSSSYRHRPLSSRLIERDFSAPSLAFDRIDDPYFFERRSRKLRDDFGRRIRRRFDDDFDRRIRWDFDDDFDRRLRWNFDDDFGRPLRWRFNDDLFDDSFFKSSIGNNSLGFERNIPINYRQNNSSVSTVRNIPIQYISSPSTVRRENVYKKIDTNNDWTSNSFQRNNDNFDKRENRISTDNWSSNQESPTRKRTTMTVFVRPPRIQYSDPSYHQRTTSTPNYPSSNRTNYY